MSFIGVVSSNEEFELIKKELCKNNNCLKLQLICINKNNIENMKNIKFETIIICLDIDKLENKKPALETVLKNARYLLINSDVSFAIKDIKNNEIEIITYGMNRKATVTASSIKEDEVLICFQRNIKNTKGDIIEIQEFKVKTEDITNNSVYNILVAVTLNKLYN